ncbi:shikimate kinase [Haloferula luteola]|uniref:Shikimate kinase n=1 Tax=Haloferula luteola TaxID=595692 RepID=A0A840VCC5_9BACT|nr:shikimate kinase [Haloferula luteola]MBB5353194.1 shikimate kinase [Haloferula luteola]
MNTAPGPKQNIVLIGFMGCGKTTIGRILARMLGCPFVDLDQLIEEKAGTTISSIFAERGEPYFRLVEAAILHELAAPGPQRVISTGGGIITRRRSRRLLKQLGYVVWLQAPVEIILDRTRRNRDRPLLETEDPKSRIQALLDHRQPHYREVADLEIDTSGLDPEETACGILESARYHFAH